MTHVIIIGGGISGLAAAFYLQKLSREQNLAVTYTVLEAGSRFGGKVVTEITPDNFIVEGGPDSFVTYKPWAKQLCHDLGLDDQLIPTNDAKRNIFVLNNGSLAPFPGGMRLTIPTELIPFITSPLISVGGKLRMALDFLIPANKNGTDESLASFIRRRLGQEAVDKFAGPIMAGIYMADPERLSLQSTFPSFIEMEQQHGSLIRAMQVNKKKQAAKQKSPTPAMFMSLKGGMGQLIDTLVQQLDGDLKLNCAVDKIEQTSAGYRIYVDEVANSYIEADQIIVTTPAKTTAHLIQHISPKTADILNAIRYVSSATISLGYRRIDVADQHDFNGFGFLIPKTEQRKIVACTWMSTKFEHRAPQDGVLLRAFVGGYQQEELVELSNEALVNLVKDEIADIMGVRATPQFHQIYRWQHSNPQYDVGHLDRVAKIDQLIKQTPGLHLAGSAYRGVGLPDCIKGARAASEAVLETIQLTKSTEYTVQYP